MFRRKWELVFVAPTFESSYGKFWTEARALDHMLWLNVMVPSSIRYLTVRRIR